jgi:hypothetical protein
MEQVLTRFPHLGDKIFQNLNSHTLIRCKEVSRTCENFMKVKRSGYLRIIQWYTNYSETLMEKIVKKFGGSIIVVSILREIFGSNRPLPIGWDEGQNPEGQKYYMNHITKSTQWEDPRITMRFEMHENSQHDAKITGISTSPLSYGWSWHEIPNTTGIYCYIHLSTNRIRMYDPPIPQPSIPQFVTKGVNLGKRKHKQRLLQLQRQKWIWAISENNDLCYFTCITKLLSFFSLELPKEEKVILDVNSSLAMQGGGELGNLEGQISRYEAIRGWWGGGHTSIKSLF